MDSSAPSTASRAFTRATVIAAGVIAGAGLIVLYHFEPTTAGFYPQCVFHALTGWQCPGCGGTRALYALLHGRYAAAFRLNPAIFFYAPVLAYGGGDYARALWTGTETRPLTTKPWLSWAIVASLTVFWIARNL